MGSPEARPGGPRVANGDSDYGTVAAGKIADLLVLDADPLQDIANTRKIHRVMQAGNWLEP